MRELLGDTLGLIGKLAIVIAGIYWIVCWAFHLVFNWYVPIILGLIFLLTIGMAKIEED